MDADKLKSIFPFAVINFSGVRGRLKPLYKPSRNQDLSLRGQFFKNRDHANNLYGETDETGGSEAESKTTFADKNSFLDNKFPSYWN